MARKIEIQITGDAKNFQSALGKAAGSADGFGSSLAKMGKLAAVAGAAVAVGLAVGLKKSVESAVDFERAMRNVNSIAGLSEKGFGNLQKSVLSMAAAVGQKPKVLAEGLYDIVSSGFKANDAVKILAVSAKAATAGLTDTSTATKAVTAALNAYHQGAGKAREVSDILFQTVNKGVLTFEELSQQMGDLVPASAPLGISLKEVGAGMATLTLQGVPAAEAATRMKNAMLSLAKPTPALSALLKEQGFASGEAAIKSEGFAGVLDILSKATGGSVAAQAKLTPEIRTLLGVVGLTGKNLETYNANLKAMDEATRGAGVTARVFAEQSKGVALGWQKASAALDVIKIQIGTALLPALQAGLQGLSGFLGEFAKAEGASAKFGVAMDAIKSIASDAAAGLVAVFNKIDWSKTWDTLVASAGTVATRLRDALDAKLGAVDWGNVGAKIADGISNAIQAVGAIGKKIGDTITAATHQINWVDVGKTAGPGLAAALVTAFATIMDVSFWIKNWDLALAVGLAMFGKGLGKLVAPMGSALKGMLSKTWDDAVVAITSPIEKWFPKIAAVLLGVLNKLPAIVATGLAKLIAPVTTAFSKLSSLAQFTVRVLGITVAINAIGQFVSAAWGKFKELLDKIATLPGQFSAAAAAIGRAIVAGILSGLTGLPGQLADKLGGYITSAIGWAGVKLRGSGDFMFTAHRIGEPMAQGIVDGFDGGLARFGPRATAAVAAFAGTIAKQIVGSLTQQEAAWTKFGAALTPVEAQLAKMTAAQERASLASAVIEARDAMTAARAITNIKERNTAILAAEEQMRTAQLAITTARLTQIAEAERIGRDKQVAAALAAIERMRAQIAAKTEALGSAFDKLGAGIDRAFGAKTQQLLTNLGSAWDVQIGKVRSLASELTAGERALQGFQQSLTNLGPTASEVELSALDAGESKRGRDTALSGAQGALAKAQAIVEDPTKVRELADAKIDLATAEGKLSAARSKAVVDLSSYEKAVREATQKVSDLQAGLVTGKAEAILAAEEQLRTAQLAITRARLTEQATAERTARDEANAARLADLTAQAAAERTARDAQAAERIAAMEVQKAAELQNLEEFRRIQGEQLVKQLTQLQTNLAKHPKEWAKTKAAIIKLLKGYGVEFNNAGELLGNAFASGMTAATKAVEKAASGLAKAAAKYFPQSPAEKGPLSKPIDWKGYLTAGMPTGGALAGMASGMVAGMAGGGGGPRMAMAGGGGGGGGNTYNLTVNGWVGNERELSARFLAGIRELDRTQTGGRVLQANPVLR